MASYFNDPALQTELLRFIIHDRNFLRDCGHLLTPQDFVGPGKGETRIRANVAELALDFWNRYREPVGKLLRAEMIQHARKVSMSAEDRYRFLKFGVELGLPHRSVAAEAMEQKVRKYKMERKVDAVLDQVNLLQNKGTLDAQAFMELARTVLEQEKPPEGVRDFFSDQELEARIERRLLNEKRVRVPAFLIEPLDRLVRGIYRRHLGLAIAPYGRGKSLWLIWLALAYTLQSLNVLHVSLEDTREDVEERFDAAVTSLPMARLSELEGQFRERFGRFRNMLRSRLKLVDGTEQSLTIPAIESIWEQERQRGFTADVVLVDYDDEIRPTIQQKERRLEFSDIYRQFRGMLARHDLIGWTASQTGRGTEELKIIRGKKVAEDIGKMRKATMVISIGQGEWGEGSAYLWVEKCRVDRKHVGCNVMMDLPRAVFYDRDATRKMEQQGKEAQEEEPEDVG